MKLILLAIQAIATNAKNTVLIIGKPSPNHLSLVVRGFVFGPQLTMLGWISESTGTASSGRLMWTNWLPEAPCLQMPLPASAVALPGKD